MRQTVLLQTRLRGSQQVRLRVSLPLARHNLRLAHQANHHLLFHPTRQLKRHQSPRQLRQLIPRRARPLLRQRFPQQAVHPPARPLTLPPLPPDPRQVPPLVPQL